MMLHATWGQSIGMHTTAWTKVVSKSLYSAELTSTNNMLYNTTYWKLNITHDENVNHKI